jgi:hypothetical protein
VNPNPTFIFHSQWVVLAEIEAIGEKQPEDLEIIGKARLFTLSEINSMTETGELDDGLLLAGLGLYGTVPEYRLCPLVPRMRLRLGLKSSK